MTTEVLAAPGAAADTAAPVEIANPPEAANPESNEAKQPEPTNEQPEQGDADKSVKRLQRRVDRVTADKYQAIAEAQQLRQKLDQYERQAQPQEDQTPIKPEDVDRIANERADHIAQAREVDRRGAEISSQLLKLAGSDEAVRSIVNAVREEAGDLIDPRTGRWTPLGEAIEASDNTAALLEFLSKNDDVSAGLRGLSAVRLGRKVAALDAQVATKSAGPKASNAPKPLEPVKASGATSGPTPGTPDYVAWKMKQLSGG